MRHNRPWEENWYDRRAREENPLRNNSISGGSGLESSVNDASIGGNYSNNGFIRRAGIGSSLLLAAYMLLITSCGGQAAPTPSPTSTAQRAISTPAARQETSTPQPTLEATVAATSTPPQIPIIIDKPTYDVIFPFKEPSNDMERALLKTTDAVTYMKFVRAQNNFDLNVSLAKIVGDFFGHDSISIIPDTINAYRHAVESAKLNEVYISLDTIRIYLNSLPINQTYVEAKPFYFQQTSTRQLIPLLGDIVMDNETFFTLKKKYSNPFVALALSKGLSEDIVSKLHIFSKDKSLENVDARIISLLANNHPEVQRVLSDQLMEEGSTPFGRVPASFNYSRSDIETLDSLLKPFEAMKNLPFVEGKNVLLFYQPSYSKEKYDTKKFLDKVEAIKLLDLAYDIQTELMGYRQFGDQKRLFLHSFDFKFSRGQPVITALIDAEFISHPIVMMSDGAIPNLMYSFLSRGTSDPDFFTKPLELLNLDSTWYLIYSLTIEELFNTHVNKFNPEVQETLDRRYKKDVIDTFALAFKYSSGPDNYGYSGISIIRKVGENQGEDFYKNFFRIWNNVKPYVNANPGVVNDQYPYTNFFGSNRNGERINDPGLVSNTLVISALSAAAGKDLRQQFSEYRMFKTHQGLFEKTLPFFRDVLDYSRNTQK